MIGFDPTVIENIRRHAEDAYPNECCGALLGDQASGVERVTEVVPLDNRREDGAARRRFLVTGDDYRALEARAAASKLDVIGFYHSHPDHPAEPSDFDREHALPTIAYMIVSVERGTARDVKCWTLADDRSGFVARVFGSNGSSPLER